jgi:hypothetical protein
MLQSAWPDYSMILRDVDIIIQYSIIGAAMRWVTMRDVTFVVLRTIRLVILSGRWLVRLRRGSGVAWR